MRRLILRNFQAPGDIVMLTAAVRDLHLAYPGEFETDVRTSCDEIWQHNPYITPLSEDDPSVQIVDCEYPAVHQSNRVPLHFVQAFGEFLCENLRIDFRPTEFKGDIYLSDKERTSPSVVAQITGSKEPYWIVVAGGKNDFTIKWWATDRYQSVVDHFADAIQFVQVGSIEDHHPRLDGVLDLRGKTSLRDLIRLVFHSAGVLCPVTLLMHLAAAVPTTGSRAKLRPCVVIAGGREPVHWFGYPGHQIVHTIGALDCCLAGGCWRSRTSIIGDGSSNEASGKLCLELAGALPKCMDLITPQMVTNRIETYFRGGASEFLNRKP